MRAVRCGQRDTEVVCETAPTGVMYDDYVEEVDERSELQTPARGSSKRTRRIENGGASEPLQTFAALVPAVEQVGQCMSRILSSEEAIGRGENSAGGVQKAADAAREYTMRNLKDRKTLLLDVRIIS
jgi:hypothetical protein